MKPISVLIVDDHPLFRHGVAGIVSDAPDMLVAGAVSNGRQAVELYRSTPVDIVIMDMQMPELDGIEATAILQRDHPLVRVIVLTTFDGDIHARRALKAGASGYMLKSAVGDELVDVIRAVHAGKIYIAPSVAVSISSNLQASAVTEREAQVLELASTGKTNRLIGAQLSISEETVKMHMKSVLAKLGARDRTHAVVMALERGIIELRRRLR
ncbi:response regulator transcription factor [Massilia sp. BSC265]|uniref:response regulator n=1 Tax=Massilia sp. BSC265 TaxID=1549812 RepID=UPI0004E9461D|nr:response regulator transcription factor [Massilia sp. BSC265]KFI08109.1 LuxR family transcriptional regulator [Massilia sp. BSC265]